ncbi:cytochrome c oxidase assembly protein [Neobacillus vireti]|uniref:cytochrome c oxidase assembly protein n=1 Tax=Neobacillus vireti TaxID=220686 RepID=UPI002FFF351C
MKHNHVLQPGELAFESLMALPFLLAIIFYIITALISNKGHKRWPFHRYFCWAIGILCAGTALFGPIADSAHVDFTAHMMGHLLLGMLAPLLLALGAPMTLLLRTLSVVHARRLSQVLKSWPVSFYSNPAFAALINIGGLWVLYATDLYMLMLHNTLIHVVVHFHVFLAGYLFTISIIYIDPIPHKYSFPFRAAVLILSLAAHGILSKYIYAHPPAYVPIKQAEWGGMIMYYGGDLVDIVLIFLFCRQWYQAARPRDAVSISQ